MIKEWILRKLGANNTTLPHPWYGSAGVSTAGAKNMYSKNQRFPLNELSAIEKFSFKVFTASGGKIIEFRSCCDDVSDDIYSLHIITDEEDFAQALGNIVMIELLRS